MLTQQLKNAPSSAGIYQFFDQEGMLLYVGKAKILKNRVKSYFRFSTPLSPSPTLSPRIYKMILEAHKVEYIVVQSEHDALILENSLIKQLKPKYNILLRDDKTYPYITVDLAEEFPRFEISRKVIEDKNRRYFGPFSSSAKALLDALYLAFPLVQKRRCVQGKKACLFHQIKRCLAPCEGKVDIPTYARIVQDALSALREPKILMATLEEKMHTASLKLNFEEAVLLRDMIASLKQSLHVTHVELLSLENYDVFALAVEGKMASIMRLFVREGKIVSTSHSNVHNAYGFDKDELYQRALFEFYNPMHQSFAQHILVAEAFAEKKEMALFLSEKFGKKIDISIPKRGEKRHLVEMAQENAHTLLEQTRSKNSESVPESLRTLFDLAHTPSRIEIFDNSHLGGKSPVGAMVVWEDGFQKSSYRRYALHHSDEYAQMKEMLERRIGDFDKEPPPDMWLLDGGETLLKLANTLLDSQGFSLPVLAIAKEKIASKAHRAKGSARDRIWTKEHCFTLSPSDKRLQFMQRLRDEAHRFAIAYHQKKKRSHDMQMNLLESKGVGHAILKKLLATLGTFEAIYEASCEEFETILGEKMGKKIFNSLKK